MFIRLNLDDDTPIYAQLMQQIVEGIAGGDLKPGERLPSVRSLAADLGVNLHTVNKAYTLLQQEGYIRIIRQKGVVVQPARLPGLDEAYMSSLRRKLRPLIAEAIARGLDRERFAETAEGIYRQIIGHGEVDPT